MSLGDASTLLKCRFAAPEMAATGEPPLTAGELALEEPDPSRAAACAKVAAAGNVADSAPARPGPAAAGLPGKRFIRRSSRSTSSRTSSQDCATPAELSLRETSSRAPRSLAPERLAGDMPPPVFNGGSWPRAPGLVAPRRSFAPPAIEGSNLLRLGLRRLPETSSGAPSSGGVAGISTGGALGKMASSCSSPPAVLVPTGATGAAGATGESTEA